MNRPVRPLARATVASLLLLLAGGCGHGAEKVRVCRGAWTSRIDSATAISTAVDAAAAKQAEREAALSSGTKEIEKKLAEVTVAYAERESYAAKVKGLVAKQKMRLGTMDAHKRTPDAKGMTLHYELELQGDEKYVVKALQALYDQPKLFFLERVELNITDPYKKWVVATADGWVYEPPEASPAQAGGEGLAAKIAVLGGDDAPPECTGVAAQPDLAGRLAAVRAQLVAKTDAAKAADALDAREARLAARQALLADLTRRRDDNRALFSARFDELLRRAQGSVTLLCELKFRANGEPDWK